MTIIEEIVNFLKSKGYAVQVEVASNQPIIECVDTRTNFSLRISVEEGCCVCSQFLSLCTDRAHLSNASVLGEGLQQAFHMETVMEAAPLCPK